MSVILQRTLVEASLVPLDPNEFAESLSVTLTQPSGSTSRWDFRVRCRTDEGITMVGRFQTAPPRLGSVHTRVVAMAFCPGAREWLVDVVPGMVSSDTGFVPTEPDNSSMSLAQGTTSGQLAGVQRVGERFRLKGGTGVAPAPAGSLFVHSGETLLSWKAWATAAGETVQIATGIEPVTVTIPIPPGGEVIGGGSPLWVGPALLVFSAGVGAWMAEIAESA